MALEWLLPWLGSQDEWISRSNSCIFPRHLIKPAISSSGPTCSCLAAFVGRHLRMQSSNVLRLPKSGGKTLFELPFAKNSAYNDCLRSAEQSGKSENRKMLQLLWIDGSCFLWTAHIFPYFLAFSPLICQSLHQPLPALISSLI